MLLTLCAVSRWADAAGRLQEADLQERRWEPVGANPSPEGSGDDGDESPPHHQQETRLVVLTDVSGPLGGCPGLRASSPPQPPVPVRGDQPGGVSRGSDPPEMDHVNSHCTAGCPGTAD